MVWRLALVNSVVAPIAVVLLDVAVVAQVADVVTGVLVRQWGLVAGAAVGTLCHAAGIVALVLGPS